MSTPIVSIVVPVYNGSNYIDTFFSCLNKQTYSDYEVILVDDGSKDDSYEKSIAYSQKDSRIKIFSKENGGPGSARNYGIERASGDYIVFFDIDDEFESNVLEDNIAFAQKNDSDVVMWNFTMVVLGTGGGYFRKIGESAAVNREEFFQKYLIPTLDNEMFNPPWNKMIRRKLLTDNNIVFHTEYSLYEDILFFYEICKKANSFAVNDNSYYTYLIKSGGSLLTKFHEECFEAIRAIYNAALDYGASFEDNSRQIKRFKEQYLYLTRGYIKQICVNRQISKEEKEKALSRIGDSQEFKEISDEFDVGLRRMPAKFMMKHGMYGSIIFYYNVIDACRGRD